VKSHYQYDSDVVFSAENLSVKDIAILSDDLLETPYLCSSCGTEMWFLMATSLVITPCQPLPIAVEFLLYLINPT
jgi:hypothetical protein